VIEREDLIEHPKYATVPLRAENRFDLAAEIQAWCDQQPSDEAIIRKFQEAHLPVAPILSVAQAMSEPHLLERGVVRSIHDRGFGALKIPNIPHRFSKYPDRMELQAPFIGEHNAQVLRKHLGYSDDKIRTLTEAGILHAEPIPAAAQ